MFLKPEVQQPRPETALPPLLCMAAMGSVPLCRCVVFCTGAEPSGKSSEDRNPCVHVGSHYRLQTLQPQPAPLLLVTARPCYKSIRKFFIDAILYNYLKLLNIYLHLNHNFENMTPSKSVRKICEICCKNTFLHNYSVLAAGGDRQ